jgi:hypothetical protein
LTYKNQWSDWRGWRVVVMKTELSFVRAFQELWFFPVWRTPQVREHAKRPEKYSRSIQNARQKLTKLNTLFFFSLLVYFALYA